MIAGKAVLVAAVAVGCAAAAACGGGAGAGPAARPAGTAVPRPSAPSAAPIATPASTLPPKETFVYLLGGSSARECIVGNRSWGDQVEKLGGGRVRTFSLAWHNESFAMDTELVKAMPAAPTVVFIGLSLGRFTGTRAEILSQCEDQDASRIIAMGAEVRHQFDGSQVLSDSRKRRLLDRWVSERYPLFQRNYAVNLAGLRRLIKECERRRFQAVLLELPVNVDIVGHACDEARRRYAQDARRLARRHGLPYLDFVDDLGLANADFYDLMHLVGPGRRAWQKRLSQELIALLDGGGS